MRLRRLLAKFIRGMNSSIPPGRFLDPPWEYPKLFILGCPRSGTTWTLQMFENHPAVINTRESHAFPLIDREIQKSGWDSDSFFPDLLKVYHATGSKRVGIKNYVSYSEFKKLILETIQWCKTTPYGSNQQAADYLIHRIFDNFFWKSGGDKNDLFVEKSPAHSLYAERILECFPDCKQLHVLRDGRDVVVSMQILSKRHDWAPKERINQIETWVKHVKELRRVASMPEYKNRVATVRFEDLKTHPARELERLFQFVHLEYSPQTISRIIKKTSFSRKFKVGPGRHSYKGIVGEWRHYLSKDDLELYARMAGALHEECGYSL